MLKVAKAKDEGDFQERNIIIAAEASRVERTPWLNRAGWLRMFVGRDMKILSEVISEKVTEGENLEILGLSVNRAIRRCLASVVDCDKRGWELIRFWLQSTEAGKANKKPFRLHYDHTTVAINAQNWVKYLYFCIRTLDMEESGVEFTINQRQCLNELRGMAILDQPMEEELDAKVLEASFLLIMHSDYDPVFSSLKYFCGVNGFNIKSGRWKRPANYTPFLASIQFCIRIIGVEYALPTRERNRFRVTEDHTPLSVFKRFWQKWLVEGEPTPFNYVHQLMNYGMNIAKNCKGDDKIRFSADGKQCYYKTHQFDMLEWKEMPKEILRNAELILSRRLLFQNSDTVTAVNPYIRDDEGIADVGHFFGETICDYRHIARSTIIDNLRAVGKFDSIARVTAKDVVWQERGIREYTTDQEEFLELILVAMNFTCGQTGRGMEMLSIVFKNITAADRNVILLDGQIMISTEYHKSQAIMDDIKVYLYIC